MKRCLITQISTFSLTAITKGVVSIKPSCRYQAAITAVTKGVVDIYYTHRKGVITIAGKNRAKNSVFIDKTGEILTGPVQLTNDKDTGIQETKTIYPVLFAVK